jgi:hypothetical protein
MIPIVVNSNFGCEGDIAKKTQLGEIPIAAVAGDFRLRKYLGLLRSIVPAA